MLSDLAPVVCTACVGDLFSAGALDTLLPHGEGKVILLAASSWTDTIFEAQAVSHHNFCELRVADFGGTSDAVDALCL